MSLTRLKSRFGQGCIPSEGSGGEWISLSFPASVDCNPWLQAIFKANLIRQSSSQIRSDQISRSVMSDSLWPHESQHARPPCPSPTPGVHPDSLPSSRWCHPAISSSVVPLSSCLQSFLAAVYFSVSQFFSWGSRSIGALASASDLPMKIQDWFSLGWTGLISLQFKGLSRVFSNITVQKQQFFGTQLSL